MGQRILNEDPFPDLFDRRMSAAEMARLKKVHSRKVLEASLKRLTCPECETVYDGQGDRDKCMRWHKGLIS
jgi:hypothetical protein